MVCHGIVLATPDKHGILQWRRDGLEVRLAAAEGATRVAVFGILNVRPSAYYQDGCRCVPGWVDGRAGAFCLSPQSRWHSHAVSENARGSEVRLVAAEGASWTASVFYVLNQGPDALHRQGCQHVPGRVDAGIVRVVLFQVEADHPCCPAGHMIHELPPEARIPLGSQGVPSLPGKQELLECPSHGSTMEILKSMALEIQHTVMMCHSVQVIPAISLLTADGHASRMLSICRVQNPLALFPFSVACRTTAMSCHTRVVKAACGRDAPQVLQCCQRIQWRAWKG